MPAHRRVPNDRGAVTVEAAITLSSLVVLLTLTLAAVEATAEQLRCMDAAREAARLTARGEEDQAQAAAARIAPQGAEVTITMENEHIEVHVEATPTGGLLPGLHLEAEAFAVREPDG